MPDLPAGIFRIERGIVLSSEENVDGERSGDETWWIYTSPDVNEQNYVRESCGFIVGGRHPYDRQQVLLKIRVDLENIGMKAPVGLPAGTYSRWKMTLSYGPWNPAERGDPSQAANPLSMPPRVSFDYEQRVMPVWLDRDEKSIRNTAGDSFDPPIELEYYLTVIRIERNERADLDLTTFFSLNNKINESQWLYFDPETVKISPIVVPALEYSQQAKIYYRPMVYTLIYNPFTWYAQPLNVGWRELFTDSNGKKSLRDVRDDSGTVVQSPALLDNNGKALKPGFDPKLVLTGKFGIYYKTDFGVLNFDNIMVPPPVLA